MRGDRSDDSTNGCEGSAVLLTDRSPSEVLADHLKLRSMGALEEDLRRNYAEDVLLLTENSVLYGQDGIRKSAARLQEQLPNAKFEFQTCQVAQRYALLIWRAASDRYAVDCGVDTFLISKGKIRMQTLHYNLILAEASASKPV